MLSSAVVYLCVVKAREPPDADHPYGHGKIESLGTLFVAGALLTTGAAMGAHSAMELAHCLGDLGSLGSSDLATSLALPHAGAASTSASTSAAATAGAALGIPSLGSTTGLGEAAAMGAAACVAGGSVVAKEALYRCGRQSAPRAPIGSCSLESSPLPI